MSVFKMIEEEAHLLLQELNQHIIHQSNKGNKINEKLQEILTALDKHVNPSAPAAPVVAPAPVDSAAVSAPAPVAEPVVEAAAVAALVTPTIGG
jgi:uncharacterized coiled-coil protein SlyX